MERATSFEQLSGLLGLVINTFCPIAHKCSRCASSKPAKQNTINSISYLASLFGYKKTRSPKDIRVRSIFNSLGGTRGRPHFSAHHLWWRVGAGYFSTSKLFSYFYYMTTTLLCQIICPLFLVSLAFVLPFYEMCCKGCNGTKKGAKKIANTKLIVFICSLLFKCANRL